MLLNPYLEEILDGLRVRSPTVAKERSEQVRGCACGNQGSAGPRHDSPPGHTPSIWLYP